jgi:hypothetical protein
MIEPIKIIDDFYLKDELGFIYFEALINYFTPSYQPDGKWYQNRNHAYPCYQTKNFDEQTYIYTTLFNKLNPMFNNKIKTFKTCFRKILKSEVLDNRSQFKSDAPLRHHDSNEDFAGVIYLTNFSIMDGTKLFTLDKNQYEPDIVIGAKPNRMILYNAKTWHEPSFDKNNDVRFIQTFFIILKKENEK